MHTHSLSCSIQYSTIQTVGAHTHSVRPKQKCKREFHTHTHTHTHTHVHTTHIPVSQGCFRACAAVRRLVGSGCRHASTKSLASFETASHPRPLVTHVALLLGCVRVHHPTGMTTPLPHTLCRVPTSTHVTRITWWGTLGSRNQNIPMPNSNTET